MSILSVFHWRYYVVLKGNQKQKIERKIKEISPLFLVFNCPKKNDIKYRKNQTCQDMPGELAHDCTFVKYFIVFNDFPSNN